MNHHRAEEFSLQVAWSPKVNRQAPPTPGFYVRAAFANEGDVFGVVKDTGRGGHGTLASDTFLVELFQLLEREGMLAAPCKAKIGLQLADHAHQRQTAALASKRAHLEALRKEIADLEAEIGQ